MTLADTLLKTPTDDPAELTGLAAPRVVVAVDGRPASADALAWAADEALCRGMRLRIVTAFADPESPPHVPRTVEQALRCQQRLRLQLQKSRPWLETECVVRRGSMRNLLIEATEPGDMLVVGEAAEVSAMDASVRPRCPVVIVPAQSPVLQDR